MKRKPDELKRRFSNGQIPTEADFGDLVDSFVTRDQLTDEQLPSLYELIEWWRGLSSAQRNNLANSATQPAPAPLPADISPSGVISTAVQTGLHIILDRDAPSSGIAADQPVVIDLSAGVGSRDSGGQMTEVLADGQWYFLPLSNATPGNWRCSAVTLNARSGYRVTNNAMAVIGKVGMTPRLVQNVTRDSLLFWHTIQFSFRKNGTSTQLAVRSRYAFGPAMNGVATRIQCQWTLQPEVSQ